MAIFVSTSLTQPRAAVPNDATTLIDGASHLAKRWPDNAPSQFTTIMIFLAVVPLLGFIAYCFYGCLREDWSARLERRAELLQDEQAYEMQSRGRSRRRRCRRSGGDIEVGGADADATPVDAPTRAHMPPKHGAVRRRSSATPPPSYERTGV